MNIEVTRDNVTILEQSETPHENEYKITTCCFTFDEFTSSFQVKRAIFTILSTGEMYETDIINNQCDIPSEVLKHEYETVKLGVYGYNIGDNEELLNRFSPSYAEIVVPTGSYKEGALSPEPITPSQYDLYSQALQEGLQEVDDKLDEVVETVDGKIEEVDNKLIEVDTTVNNKMAEVDDKIGEVDDKLDEVDDKIEEVNTAITETNNLNLDVSDKVDGDVIVTLTKKDASTKSVVISDGTSLQFMWQGTSLGIKTDDMQEYIFVDLQGIQGVPGPQGEPFRIKKTYSSVAEMNADFNNMEYGDYVMIASTVEVEDNAKLYTRGESQWIFITDFSGAQGIKGETGATPNIQIGTVTSGSVPDVTRTGTNENPVLNFVLQPGPQGQTGQTGPTGNGIDHISLTSQSGATKVYTIYYTDGTTSEYTVQDGEVTQEVFDEEIERANMIYNAMPKVSGEGTDLTLDKTAECPVYKVELSPSELEQESTSISGGDEYDSPSPEHPQQIHTVSGENTVVSTSKDYLQEQILYDGYINSNDVITSATNWKHSDYIDITNLDYYVVDSSQGQNPKSIIYNANKQPIQVIDINNNLKKIYDLKNYTGAKYLRISCTVASLSTQHLIAQREYLVNLGDLEYCKIGNYEDEFVKRKNLFNKEVTTFDGYVANDGTETLSVNYKTSDYIPIEPNTTYATGVMTNSGSNPSRCYYDENKTFISGEKHFGATTMVGTSPNNAKYMRESIPIVDIDNVMINEGTSALPYIPYGSGKWYLKKNIGKVVLDGTEEGWFNDGGGAPFSVHVSLKGVNNKLMVMSDYFRGVTYSSSWTVYDTLVSTSAAAATNPAIKFRYIGMGGLEAFKTWLSTHNTTVYYVLATPTYTLLSDTLQTQLDNLSKAISYQDQTNVSQTNNDLPFVIKMSAIRDLSGIFELIQG